MSFKGKLSYPTGDAKGVMALSVDTGATGVLDAVGDIAGPVDVTDLDHISVMVNQITDGGTTSIVVEKSIDGVNWATVGTVADTNLPAGANTAKEVTLSDASGMPTRAKQVRVRMAAFTAGGSYTANIVGSSVGRYT